ncbi:hypothetical protein [Litchfieldia salsa]|uniref:Uncharacterized protein n=1 Tax=Litchfieldia salsa TaxID=930152 RepID=A0A1H0S787_9BACI|nr:hypothetical protein [Litchfieldia salsa]SDP37088.1 hypothetical protein SAMN05216565_102557 [Litchfieldia salsa]
MIFRLFIFLIGFGISIAGGISTIAYLNLLATGSNIIEYLSYISSRIECYLLPLGLIIIWLSIYVPSSRKRE